MRFVAQGFCLVCLLAGSAALTACVSGDAGVRSRQQQEAECTRYQVHAPGQDPQSMRDQSRYDSRNRSDPYYGPPPNAAPDSPVPVVSCESFE